MIICVQYFKDNHQPALCLESESREEDKVLLCVIEDLKATKLMPFAEPHSPDLPMRNREFRRLIKKMRRGDMPDGEFVKIALPLATIAMEKELTK